MPESYVGSAGFCSVLVGVSLVLLLIPGNAPVKLSGKLQALSIVALSRATMLNFSLFIASPFRNPNFGSYTLALIFYKGWMQLVDERLQLCPLFAMVNERTAFSPKVKSCEPTEQYSSGR